MSQRVSTAEKKRVLVVWCPDWPVHAAGASQHSVAAVLFNGRVLACTSLAREEGVRRGMRKRDAQSRCPELELFNYESARDAYAFESVLKCIEELSAGVQAIRPGLCAINSPERFYGGEDHAGAVISQYLVEQGYWDCRVGVADTLFAAEQAARQAEIQTTTVVKSRDTLAFLGELPISSLDTHSRGAGQITGTLQRLGLATVGDFAAIDSKDVTARFGKNGLDLHRLARGIEFEALGSRKVPPEFERGTDFEPPVDNAEQLAFSLRQLADGFVSTLSQHGLVATSVRIVMISEAGIGGERTWLHPRWFTGADLLDRVRWQLESQPQGAAIARVVFIPEEANAIGKHAETLFGAGPHEQVDRSVARVQGMLGHESVHTAAVQGGRNPDDRQRFIRWGEPSTVSDGPAALPWPDSVPDPAPTHIYENPIKATVLAHRGEPVRVNGRGMINADPAKFRFEPCDSWNYVAAWTGPWPVDERWWDESSARRVARFQIVGIDGNAWLMAVENGSWWVEAGYA